MFRRYNSFRKARFEHLSSRVMFAVISANGQTPQERGESLAAAIATANLTEESDVIELVAGTYDLSSVESPTLVIDAEIELVGVSAADTKILPAAGFKPLLVRDGGDLSVRQLTVWSTYDYYSGGLQIEAGGHASLMNSAIISLADQEIGQEINPDAGSDPLAPRIKSSTLVHVAGGFTANLSLLGGSQSRGIIALGGTVELRGSQIIGTSDFAISGLHSTIDVIDSQIAVPGDAIYLGASKLSLVNSVVVSPNHLESIGFVSLSGFRGLPSEFKIDDLSMVVTSLQDGKAVNLREGSWHPHREAEQNDFGTFAAAFQSTSTFSQADASSSFVGLVSGSDRGDGVMAFALNVDTGQFHFDPLVIDPLLVLESEPLPLLRLDDIPLFDDGDLNIPLTEFLRENVSDISAVQHSAWLSMRVTSVRSESGRYASAYGVGTTRAGGPVWFRYRPGSTSLDSERLIVRGLDRSGELREGIVDLGFVKATPGLIQFDAVATATDDINMNVSLSLQVPVSQWNAAITYDSNVVKPVLVENPEGEWRPGLTVHDGELPGVAILQWSREGLPTEPTDANTGLYDFAIGSVQFTRIGAGDANIALAPDIDWTLRAGKYELGPESFRTANAVWDRFDVDRNGGLSAIDALRIINVLNEQAETAEMSTADVNGDGHVTALDALLVINQLNSRDVNGEAIPAIPADHIFAQTETWTSVAPSRDEDGLTNDDFIRRGEPSLF